MSIHIAADKNEIAESVLLPGDPLRAKFIAENYLTDAKCYTDIRNMLGYTGLYRGCPVSVQGTGMGMPSMGIYSWELITDYDVQRLIRIGTAGSFHEDIEISDVVLSISTSTDSNFSSSFMIPSGYAPAASWTLLVDTYEENKKIGLALKAGKTFSGDVFYETDENWWKKWQKMDVLAVEMEAAALYMNCAYHGVDGLAMMTITDHFITGEKADTEERLLANGKMFELALNVAIK